MSSLLELLRQKKQDLAATGNRIKTSKPGDGTSRWRILPSWRGAGHLFHHEFGQHFIKDSMGKVLSVYACTEKTYNRPCPVCDALRQGSASVSDDITGKLLKDASSSERILVNALLVSGPNPSEVQILELAPTAFRALIDICYEWEEAGQSILDLDTGKDIMITRSGAGLLTKYVLQVSAMSKPVPADVLTRLHNLDDYVNQESSEVQIRALNSIRSVTGLLAAPSTSGLPAAAQLLGASHIEDPYAVAAPPVRPAPVRPVAAAMIEDVAPKPVPVPAPTPKAAVKPVAVPADEPTGDAELDAMLAELG